MEQMGTAHNLWMLMIDTCEIKWIFKLMAFQLCILNKAPTDKPMLKLLLNRYPSLKPQS